MDQINLLHNNYSKSFIPGDMAQKIKSCMWASCFIPRKVSAHKCECSLAKSNDLSSNAKPAPHSKQRPRSSPAYQLMGKKMRSVSVWPVRPSIATPPFARTANGKGITYDFFHQTINAIRKNDKAFFSSHPPAEPMRIVFTGNTSTQYPKVHRCKMLHTQEIPTTLYAQTQIGDALDVFPPVFIPETASFLRNNIIAQCRINYEDSNASKEKRRPSEKKKSEAMVRHLQNNFDENLPMGQTPVTHTSTEEITAHENDSVQRDPSAQDGCEDESSETQRRCSIAVQAQSNEKSVSHQPQHNEGVNEDWVGRVRALRDSHVRLVLHELRHIDRLNQALARTGRLHTRSSRKPHSIKIYS